MKRVAIGARVVAPPFAMEILDVWVGTFQWGNSWGFEPPYGTRPYALFINCSANMNATSGTA
ncbi:MAG: hypothetical protein H6Q83_704 [Deltaproteobacteria bacterium]|nr:hypothetical protein [Deltaproteobacteria bacterium]